MAVSVPAIGSVISGKYRVVRTLGVGGMAVVFEVHHLHLGQRLAVKMLHADRFASGDRVARFKREARIAAQLTSEHVTRVLDIGETAAGEPFLVMELLDGHDLADELRLRGPLPVDDAVDYVLQACEALGEAHAAGLVHRDIKPANLFVAQRPLGRPPILKVLDFGLSKAEHEGTSLTRTGKAFGTPHYMSPEQVASTKHVDGRTDQHALGAVLFELLTGRPPFEGASPGAIAVAIAQKPPPAPSALRHDIPQKLEAIVLRTMAKSPGDRFPDVAELARALAPFGGPNARSWVASTDLAIRRHRKIIGASGTEDEAISERSKRPRLPNLDTDDSSDPDLRNRGGKLPVIGLSDEPTESDAITRAKLRGVPKIYDSVSDDATTEHHPRPAGFRQPRAAPVNVVQRGPSPQKKPRIKSPKNQPAAGKRASRKRTTAAPVALAALLMMGLLFGIVATWLYFTYGGAAR